MIIYRDGKEIFEIKDFKVTGKFMEVATLDCSIKSAVPMDFKIGDYVVYDYNGLTYSLYDVPTPKKQARSGSYGEAFIYDLKFKSDMEQLVICPFLDLVANDNGLHYTSLPSFSTFENVYGIAARIQANMDYLYPGGWSIVVADVTDAELQETLNEAKDFSISGQSCLEGLKKIYDAWGVGFIHSVENGKNTITIGKSAGTTSLFRYGLGQGLRAIKKSLQNTDQFCTRVYAYGSTRNIPARWYNEKGYIGESQYAPYLMIPPSKWVNGQPQGAYIDAIFNNENRIEKYGLRIKTFSYDGSSGRDEIFPSIEKVTAGNIRSAKAELGETKYIPSSSYVDSERMDYVLTGSSHNDDGTSTEAGYELYSEKLTAVTKEVNETIIIAEPLQETKYNLLSFQKNIPLCSFEITKASNYRFTEVIDMVSLSKNDLESTVSAKWYIQIPDGSYIDLDKSLVFTDEVSGKLQLPGTTEFTANATGKYTLTLRLSVNWSVDYVVPQLDGDINLKCSIVPQTVEIARGKKVLEDYFSIKLKQIGFHLDSVTASDGSKKTISFKSGMCSGRSFIITQCEYLGNDDSWMLTCKRVDDSSVSQRFPNSIFPISAGDQFVLLNINMPDLYVHTAMQRLYDTVLADLKHYSKPQFVVSPEIDNIQMARSPQIIKEGMYMPIEDADININDDILIDGVTITENGKELRKYDVTLRNDKIYNRFSKIATSLSNLENSIEEAKKNAANTPASSSGDSVTLEDMPTQESFFERVNIGTKEAPVYTIQPKQYKGLDVGIISKTFITAGGQNSEGGGGTVITTLGGLTNVADNVDQTFDKIKVLVKEANSAEFTLVDYITSGGGTADSIEWSKVINKPTTLGGYGIKDALTFTAYDNYVAARFATNALATTAAQTYIEFWQSGAGYFNLLAGKFITAGGKSSHFVKGDGSLDSNEYLRKNDAEITGTLKIMPSPISGVQAGLELYDSGYGNGEAVKIKWSSASFTDGVELYAVASSRVLYFDSNVVIHSGNIANQTVGTANKLAKTVKIWGQDFNGSGNVSGSMTDVMNVTPASAHSFNNGSASNPWSTVYTRYLDTYTGYDLRFKVGGSEQMRLTAAKGCLILGDSSVAEPENCKLWLNGNMIISSTTATSAKSNKLRFLRNTVKDEYWDFGLYSQTTKGLTFFMSINGTDTDIAYLDGNGNFVTNGAVTAGQASDRRLKDNVQSMNESDALTVLKALNPVTFQWNTIANQLGQLSGISDGFIADEYEKLIPNSGRSIWANYRAIDYTRVSSYLVKGWQIHETRLEVAEKKIKELEEELKRYRRATL